MESIIFYVFIRMVKKIDLRPPIHRLAVKGHSAMAAGIIWSLTMLAERSLRRKFAGDNAAHCPHGGYKRLLSDTVPDKQNWR